MTEAQKTRELKGIHVLAIVGSAFAVIIAVNLTLAWKAVSTFPGLDVQNSYVASQNFDQRRAAQEALGWTVDQHYVPGRFSLAFTDSGGAPVMVSALSVLIGRTTVATADQQPEFIWNGTGYEAALSLAPGEWMMKIQAEASDGTLFERREDFILEE
ncbi:FixH family protein [Pseudogemmobacter faecipullorum]|uniref:FixH family protein n=1 Tax=Pseudogemmobacter faecipullorum TaxID=2755041 RepID=A0ABS8CJV1_9RHOB|nr:FixH family protein [Pseudogemmobacter faecipullorum]MCB5409649.1 FixH family protein [Pseudogemmobacter faecipullorum]